MDRYRTIVKLEEVRTLAEKGDYEGALEGAKELAKTKLKDASDIFLLAEICMKNKEYGVARKLLRQVYEKKPSYRVLEELMDVCLAEKAPEEASQYLQEYCKISGGDPRNYIYEYRIGRLLRRDDKELLPVLQTLKAEEYSEKYGYELAKLYYRLGDKEACLNECADLILWFGEGVYVERAKALQAYFRGEISAEELQSQAAKHYKEYEQQSSGVESTTSSTAETSATNSETGSEQEEAVEVTKPMDTALNDVSMGLDEVAATEDPAVSESDDASEDEAEPMYTEDGDTKKKTKRKGLTKRAAIEEDVRTDRWRENRVAVEANQVDMQSDEVRTDRPRSMSNGKPNRMAIGTRLTEDAAMELGDAPKELEDAALESYEQLSVFDMAAPAANQENQEMYELKEETLSMPGEQLRQQLEIAGCTLEEILKEYADIESVRSQVIRLLEIVIAVKKRCQCLIITGEQGSGKTTLSTRLAKLLYALSYLKSPRVAKIGAEKLNGMDLFEKQGQLKDCCLVIEHATALTGESVERLLRFLADTNVLSAVILEDEATAINGLLRAHPEVNGTFNNRVHLPKYSKNDLMRFAASYIREQDYELTAEAGNYLGKHIEAITRTGREGRLAKTMELVKQATKTADARNKALIFALATSGTMATDGMVQLLVEDFQSAKPEI